MNSAVIDLQRNALNHKYPLSNLLREAYVIATKLNVVEFKSWVHCELNGYKGDIEIPEYRKSRGELKGYNSYRGWVKAMLPNQEWEDLITLTHTSQSISEISMLTASGENYVVQNFGAEHLASLQQLFNNGTDMKLFIPMTSMHNILESVRNTIIDWSLRLESEGILGEGLQFTTKEKELASMSTNIKIDNFQGVLGDISNSSLTQHLDMNISKNDFDTLASFLVSNKVEQDDVECLRESIKSDGVVEPGKFGAKVSDWIGRMVAKSADGSWNVSIATAGNLLAGAITKYYGG
ncbi:hypothetical protein EXZ60_16730 [Vibrio sp. 1151_11]|uniref:AbiTii domain-containing protein n=1 Tax=Vibrio sp. 1151_11 TaxID=2527670 RepID=UPI00240537ED|nr:hypothetical protein [Vibrio sp. 1151_11]MDF9390454.1 hypothetical protein [Vibrio sp. 1151_11]